MINLGKIRTQIAIYTFILGAIIIGIMGGLIYLNTSRIVLDNTLENMKREMDRSGKYVDLFVDRLINTSSIISANSNVISYLNGDESYFAQVEKDIMTVIEGNETIKSITVVGKNGSIISNEENINMSMSSDMMTESWYIDAIENEGKTILTSARMRKFSMDKDDWVISISRNIEDTRGKNIGVALLDIEYSAIESYLDKATNINSGEIFILNHEGEVVFHKDENYFIDEVLKRDLILKSKKEIGYYKDKNEVLDKYEMKNEQWTMIGIWKLNEVENIKRDMVIVVAAAGFVLFLGVIISGTIYSRKLTNPISRLERAMENIENGLQKIEIDKRECHEAVSLGEHFNYMITQIEELMIEIKGKEKKIKENELNILKGQINPHFLYNTLETIIWMAEFENTEKVVDITKALAQFFRLSLSGGSEVVRLEAEFDHVRQYLFIQKERYGDKLDYNIVLDEKLRSIMVPKIIIQPIVENSLYHGIKELKGSGTISIYAYIEGEYVSIAVVDNGVGFDAENTENYKMKSKTKLSGIGINNVDERLKLYYDNNCGVYIHSKINEGTRAVIKVKKDIT